MLVLRVFYKFKNHYKCCEVMAYFLPLVDLEFLKSIYGSVPSIPCLFDCSWAECDVDGDRQKATRTVLEHANLPLEGYFQTSHISLYAPLPCGVLGWFENWNGILCNQEHPPPPPPPPPPPLPNQRGFFFFVFFGIIFLSLFVNFFFFP